MAAAATAPTPQIVQVSLVDIYVPSIPEINPGDVKLRFYYQQLTNFEGEPEYEKMCVVREEIYRNDLSIKSSFGGGKLGHKGLVTKPANYRIDTGKDWVVPAIGGVYQTLGANATENSKKQTITEFISRETNIKMSEVVEDQLKNQLLESLPEAFILEPCEGSRRYDGSTTLNIMKHVFTNYTKIDNTLILKNKKEFEEAPDFSLPLDIYFKKQEDFQKLAEDGKVLISETDIVLQL